MSNESSSSDFVELLASVAATSEATEITEEIRPTDWFLAVVKFTVPAKRLIVAELSNRDFVYISEILVNQKLEYGATVTVRMEYEPIHVSKKRFQYRALECRVKEQV